MFLIHANTSKSHLSTFGATSSNNVWTGPPESNMAGMGHDSSL